MYEIKWVRRWEASNLKYVKNITYLPEKELVKMKKTLTEEIVRNSLIFFRGKSCLWEWGSYFL